MYYQLVERYPYHHYLSVTLLHVRNLLVVILQVHSISSYVSFYMESYDDHYLSYDSLPYGSHVPSPHISGTNLYDANL